MHQLRQQLFLQSSKDEILLIETILRTERLELRKLQPKDIDLFYQMMSNQNVMNPVPQEVFSRSKSDDPDKAMAVAMFGASTMDLYFSGDLARTELNFGSMMSMATLVNNETEDILILKGGGMMGDKAVKTISDEMKIDELETEDPEIKITREKKTILGYNCKKAIITDADGNEMGYWFTEEIQTISTDKSAVTSKLPSLTLEYSIDRDGLIMTFTATSVDQKLDSKSKTKKFSFDIPEEYEEMTYEDFSSFVGM